MRTSPSYRLFFINLKYCDCCLEINEWGFKTNNWSHNSSAKSVVGNIWVCKVALSVAVQVLHCTLSMFSPSNNCWRSCEKLAISGHFSHSSRILPSFTPRFLKVISCKQLLEPLIRFSEFWMSCSMPIASKMNLLFWCIVQTQTEWVLLGPARTQCFGSVVKPFLQF